MNRNTANELRFAYKVKQALNESSEQLRPEVRERLAAARKAALQVQKPERRVFQRAPRLAHAGAPFLAGPRGEPGMFGRLGFALCMLMLVGSAVVGLFAAETDARINDLAEIDTGVLVDTLPLEAYTDQGFNAFLKRIDLDTAP